MKKYFAWAVGTALVIGLITEPLSAQLGIGGGGGGGGNRGGGGGGAARASGGGGGGARVGGGGGARVGGSGGVNVGGGAPRVQAGAPRVQASAPRVQATAPRAQASAPSVQTRPQSRGSLSGVDLRGGASGRITTGRPNIDVDNRVGGSAAVRGSEAGANVRSNTRVGERGGVDLGSGVGAGTRSGSDLNARVRGTLDGRAGGNLDARVRSGVDGRADARVGGSSRADRVGNFLDIEPRTGANLDARVRGDNDGRGRGDLDARTRGNLDARVRGGADAAARANLRASWADNVRLNQNVNATLANAFQASVRDRGDLDGRGDRGDWNRNDWNRNNWNRWDRDGRYGNWARNTRGYWGRNSYPYFGASWWGNYGFGRPYPYFNYWGGRPYGYWWGQPNFIGFNRWFGWNGWNGWNTPYYYSYGPTGYVVYQDDGVYVGNQLVGTPEAYAASAAQLAAIDPNDLPADHGEWMPLGTFAFVTSDSEADEPKRFLQLAVDQHGIVSGTMFNESREQAYSVEGKVDKDTQRVAFTISNDRDIVFETGIYNLTQDETQLLAHFGPDDTRTFLLVRLEEPKDGAEELEVEARMADRPTR